MAPPMAAALTLALAASLPAGGAAWCRRPPPANPTRYNYKGTHYRFPLGYGVWNSPQPVAEILYILMTEELQIDVELKPPYLSSEALMRDIAGCPEGNVPCDESAKQHGLFKDPPDLWLAAEVWATSSEERRLATFCGTAGPIGYASTPSLQTFSRVHQAAESTGELVGFWRSLYRSSATAYFSSVADVDRAIRALPVPSHFDWAFGCDAATTCTQPGIIRPGAENGGPMPQSYIDTMAASGVTMASDGWFYAPACANNHAECVPVVLGSLFWNLLEWCIVAVEQNLPLAITSVGWFGEIVAVQALFPQNMNFLFYWWRPDNTFLNLAPQMMFFKEDVLRIRQFQYTQKVIWPGIKEVDEDLLYFLSKVTLPDGDMEVIMQQMNATNKNHIACEWVKSHVDKWELWLPNRRNCLRGFYYNETLEKCTTCSAGTVTSERGMTACEPCAQGTYAKDSGQTQCDFCEPGKHAPSRGQEGCNLCPEGTYGNQSGLAQCVPCPSVAYTTRSVASLSIADCVCPANTYKPRTEEKCNPCPKNMTCVIGSREIDLPATPAEAATAQSQAKLYPLVDPGFFTTYAEPFSVYKCGIATHCPGGPPATCAGQRIGFNCAECPAGMSGTKDGCKACNDFSKVLFPLLLVPFILLVPVALYYGTNSQMTATTSVFTGAAVSTGVIITSGQIMGIFARLSVPWPAGVENMLSFFGVFHFNGADVGKACFFGYSPSLLYTFEFLPVLIVLALIFIFHFASKIVMPMLKKNPWNHNRSMNTAGTFMQVVFIMLCGSVVRPIQCYTNPNATKSNTSFTQVLCWHGGDHMVMLAFAAPVLFLLVAPFMAINVWAAFVLPAKTIGKGGKAGSVVRFRYLVYRFRPDAWWWGVVFSARQLLIAFAATVQPDDPRAQIIYLVAILTFYLAAVGRAWPWRSRELNLLDVVSITFFVLAAVSVGSFMAPTPESDAHERLLIFFMGSMFCVFGLWGLYGLSVAYRRGLGGFYGVVYPGNKTFERFADEWLTFTLFHAKRTEEEIQQWMHVMNDFDRQIIDQVVSISQGFSIRGTRKLISNSAPERLTLDLSGPPVEIPKPLHFSKTRAKFSYMANAVARSMSRTASTRTNTSDNYHVGRVLSEGSQGDSRTTTPEEQKLPKQARHSVV